MTGRHEKAKAAMGRHWGFLLVVLLAAVVVRVLYFGANHAVLSPDSHSYLAAAGTPGFLSPSRTPGYPAWLAMNFALFGRGNLGTVVLVQKLLGVLCDLLIYAIFWHLTRSRWLGLLAALVVCVHVQVAAFETRILTESITPFLVAFVTAWQVVWPRRACTRAGAAVTGLVTAALLLIKVSFIVVWVPVVVCMAILDRSCRKRSWRRTLCHIGIVAVLNIAAAGWWSSVMWRHYRIRGMTNLAGVNLTHIIIKQGLLPYVPARYARLKAAVAPIAQRFRYVGAMDEEIGRQVPGYDPRNRRMLVDMCVDTILRVPGKFAWNVMGLVPFSMGIHYYTFREDTACGAGPRVRKVFEAIEEYGFRRIGRQSWLVFLVVVGAAAVTVRRSRPRLAGWLLVFLVVWYLVIVNSCLAYGEFGRHRNPVEPLRVSGMYAGLGFVCWSCWRRARIGRRRRRAAIQGS